MKPAVTNLAVSGLLAGSYFLAGWLGLLAAIPPGYATPIWPPSGLALAAILLFGYRVWPGIFLGSFILNFVISVQTVGFAQFLLATGVSAGIGLGSTLQALVGGFLIRRWIEPGPLFDRARNVVKFVAIEMFSCLVAATFGVSSLCIGLGQLNGGTSWSDFPTLWWTWWLGDVVGILVVAPLLLTCTRLPQVLRPPWRAAEGLLFLTLLVVVTFLVCGGFLTSGIARNPLAFLVLPLFVWAAFRFGPPGVALGAILMSTIFLWMTARGMGPFVPNFLNESLILLQTFLGTTTVMGLLIAGALAERERAKEALRLQATQDYLTGLWNRPMIIDFLKRELARSFREGKPVGVVMADIDNFKDINDTHGHLAGDHALSELAARLRAVFRPYDSIGRFGGEEFLIVLPGCDDARTADLGERLREAVAREPITYQKETFPLTVSVGTTTMHHSRESNLNTLLAAADQALYQAKNQGRNRVVSARISAAGEV